MTVPRRIAARLSLLALLAGCTSSVDGRGSLAEPSPSATPAVTAAATSSPSATPELTGAGGSTTHREALSCSGRVIAPAGAPYCYSMPAGFRDVTDQVNIGANAGTTGQHRSAVALASKDLILVVDFPLNADSDKISSQSLVDQLKMVIAQFEQQGFRFDSAVPDEVTVDGARAFGYHASTTRGDYSSDFLFVFRGRHEVEINCQYATRQADIERGCAAVRGSVQVKTER
ncbi:MAG TPA: hypothetical protein VLJ59_15135 [Mycobacteriales bacterium]|nr:hypothetical protein [Mycobacteriales bacterium]